MEQVIASEHFVLNEPPVYGLRTWNGDQYLRAKDVMEIVRPGEPIDISAIYAVLTAFQALATLNKEEREKEYPQLNVQVKVVKPDNSVAPLSLNNFQGLASEDQDVGSLYIDAEWGKRIISAHRKGGVRSASEYVVMGLFQRRIHRARIFKRDGGTFIM